MQGWVGFGSDQEKMSRQILWLKPGPTQCQVESGYLLEKKFWVGSGGVGSSHRPKIMTLNSQKENHDSKTYLNNGVDNIHTFFKRYITKMFWGTKLQM